MLLSSLVLVALAFFLGSLCGSSQSAGHAFNQTDARARARHQPQRYILHTIYYCTVLLHRIVFCALNALRLQTQTPNIREQWSNNVEIKLEFSDMHAWFIHITII